jgi:hypothetical protein
MAIAKMKASLSNPWCYCENEGFIIEPMVLLRSESLPEHPFHARQAYPPSA